MNFGEFRAYEFQVGAQVVNGILERKQPRVQVTALTESCVRLTVPHTLSLVQRRDVREAEKVVLAHAGESTLTSRQSGTPSLDSVL
jgi:hypothetical protein